MDARIEVIERRLFAGVVADELVASVLEAVEERGACHIALSGGRTPGRVYRSLAFPPRVEEIPWDKVTLLWGDERWVPHDNTHSNYKMVHDTLLNFLDDSLPEVLPIDTGLTTPQEAAEAYAKLLKAQNLPLRNDLPQLDILLLGLGEDGHVASIFPDSELLNASEAVCAAVTKPETGETRVTLAPAILKNAKRILFLVTGEAKAEVMKKVFSGEGDLKSLPARLFDGESERVTWFLDSAAATKLKLK